MIKPKVDIKIKGSPKMPRRQLYKPQKGSPIKRWTELMVSRLKRALTPEERGALAFFTIDGRDEY